jgi:molecular chaperone GrpE
MSKDQETSEAASASEVAAEEETAIPAEAIAEAAEAIAGAAHDDSTTGADDGAPSSEDVESLCAERDQALDQAIRAHAELDNYRKRVARELEQAARYQMLPLIRDLLPALDNLARTIQAAGQTTNVDDLVKGAEMILAHFNQVLAGHSVKPIEAVGQPFDPNLHEAIQQLPSDEHPPGTVIQDVELGYILHDRVIRPTKVIVASAPVEASDDTESSA